MRVTSVRILRYAPGSMNLGLIDSIPSKQRKISNGFIMKFYRPEEGKSLYHKEAFE